MKMRQVTLWTQSFPAHDLEAGVRRSDARLRGKQIHQPHLVLMARTMTLVSLYDETRTVLGCTLQIVRIS